MAKFNIEVNLDWIEDDGTIDDILKEEIINTVTAKVIQQTTERIDEKLSELIDEQAQVAEQLIGEKLNGIMEDFLTKPRDVTDKYGDVVKRGISVVDMLKKACDEFMDGYVDSQGRPAASTYNRDIKRRIDWFVESKIDSNMKYAIDRATSQIRDKMQEYINDTVKSKIGENVAKAIGLENIVAKG